MFKHQPCVTTVSKSLTVSRSNKSHLSMGARDSLKGKRGGCTARRVALAEHSLQDRLVAMLLAMTMNVTLDSTPVRKLVLSSLLNQCHN